MKNSVRTNIKKIFNHINRIIPVYAIIPLIVCFSWNMLVYWGARCINADMKHFDMTLPIDRATPVIPVFVVVYFGCYISWIIYYIASVRVGRYECARFVTFDIITRTCCAVLFVVIPTYNIRPDITGEDIFSCALRFLYEIDAADNLFPSIHCLVSWNCYIGVRNIKEYPVIFKNMAAVIAVMVFISTLVTKQHVIADVISAVAISEVCWLVVNKTGVYRFLLNIMNGVKEAGK